MGCAKREVFETTNELLDFTSSSLPGEDIGEGARKKKSGWTLERRAKQAARIKIWAPWAKSTGPKTAAGKKKSANNAYKHGNRAGHMRLMRKAFTAQSRFLRNTNMLITLKRRLAAGEVSQTANELMDSLIQRVGLQGLIAANQLQHALFSATLSHLCYEKGADSAYP